MTDLAQTGATISPSDIHVDQDGPYKVVRGAPMYRVKKAGDFADWFHTGRVGGASWNNSAHTVDVPFPGPAPDEAANELDQKRTMKQHQSSGVPCIHSQCLGRP